jgi:hypothetical protein
VLNAADSPSLYARPTTSTSSPSLNVTFENFPVTRVPPISHTKICIFSAESKTLREADVAAPANPDKASAAAVLAPTALCIPV